MHQPTMPMHRPTMPMHRPAMPMHQPAIPMHQPAKINPLYAVVSWVEEETQQLAFNFGMRGAKPNLHIFTAIFR
ncbi:hypothetical protein [Nostoc sp.]|uniref:hypothetical protein n=1 Tax=Nostoc sp. TaxID=1180 RepID=UPI002FF86106